MINRDIHHLIDLIYEAAVNAERWPELLTSLADFVDQHPDLPFDKSGQVVGDVSPQLSLADAIAQLPSQSVIEPSAPVSVLNQYLLRHFQRALAVAKQLVDAEDQKERVASLLNRLPIVLMLVDLLCKNYSAATEYNTVACRCHNSPA